MRADPIREKSSLLNHYLPLDKFDGSAHAGGFLNFIGRGFRGNSGQMTFEEIAAGGIMRHWADHEKTLPELSTCDKIFLEGWAITSRVIEPLR